MANETDQDWSGLRFGTFISPFHPVWENAALLIDRDMRIVTHMDQLGFHEAWIGEHHSGGMETIPSPELFIAGVAERTQRIRLGTGVVSLPYHHPLTVADRIMQLDLQTRGRLIFGVGPGSLPSDVHMFGRDPLRIRDIAADMLDAVLRLLRGEVVTAEGEGWKLVDARCQLPPYGAKHCEVVVAATASPYGPRLAGKHGAGLLSIAATTQGGFEALANGWSIWSGEAALNGHRVERSQWRVVGPVHIAETREQALRDVAYGLPEWVRYFGRVSALPIAATPDDSLETMAHAMVESGLAVIGTPDDLIAKIELLWNKSGGFGSWLNLATDWADFDRTLNSYSLIARHVMPHFTDAGRKRYDSMEWAAANRGTFLGARADAVKQEAARWDAEKARRQGA